MPPDVKTTNSLIVKDSTKDVLQDAEIPTTLIRGDGVLKITVGLTPPSSPSVGDLWVDTNP